MDRSIKVNSWLPLITHGSNLGTSSRFAMYIGIALATLLVIWIPVALFLLALQPGYTSKWSLILPGSGAGHAVSLDSVGQATATVTSPFGNHSVDPKINYKAIVSSTQVLSSAAKKVKMSVKDFGKPIIKLVDQTAMIHFQISGRTGEETYEKSKALYASFQDELEHLRNDEQQRRENATSKMLNSFSEKLQLAQQRILEYQTHSRIVSLEQFTELTLGQERTRNKLQEMKAEHAGLSVQLDTLKTTLSTGPELASAIIRLQTDPLFQELADKQANAAAVLAESHAQWGENNFEVVTARDNHNGLKKALYKRVRVLASRAGVNTAKLVKLGSSGDRKLYSQLIELFSREQGMASRIQSLETSIIEQQKLLDSSTTNASKLEDLKRKLQVATAVFTTALAKIDLGKSNRFSTYPMVQLFSAPDLPEKPDTLGRKLALSGAVLGSIFIAIGLILLWIRKPYLQKILKNE